MCTVVKSRHGANGLLSREARRAPPSATARSGAGADTRPAPARAPVASALHVEGEVELRPAGERVEVHGPARSAVAPGAPGDRERAVLRIEERPLDRDLAAREERRPVALVGGALHRPQAVAVVRADLLGVPAVEQDVGERQDVADGVVLRARVGRRVDRRVLDYSNRLAADAGAP